MPSNVTKDMIFIEGLRVDTLIGVYPEEQHQTQAIMIDLELGYDMSQAQASDNFEYALDYDNLTLRLSEFITNTHIQLIEHLAAKAADFLFDQFSQLESLKLTLHKPAALERALDVGVRLERVRN